MLLNLVDFERFHYDREAARHTGKHSGLSVRKSGSIGLGGALFDTYNLHEHMFCDLYYDKKGDQILVKFLKDKEAGSSPIKRNTKKCASDYAVAQKMFATKYDLFGRRYQFGEALQNNTFLFVRKQEVV